MNSLIMLSFFSGASIPGSILVAAYFYYIRKEHRLKLNLLTALFIALSLRCSKSFLCYTLGMPEVGMSLGYLGLATIGPLLWLYLKYFDKTGIQSLLYNDYLHFMPAILGSSAILVFGRDFAIDLYFYTNYILLAYVVIVWSKIYLLNNENKNALGKWNMLLLGSITALCGIFLFQYHTDHLYYYTIGAAMASITFYLLLFFAIKTPILFPVIRKKVNIDPKVVEKVCHAIDTNKIYRRPSLTLDQFSRELDCPSYQVSNAIKEKYQKSFSELINYMRIKDVVQELSNENKEYNKIEGLAYSAGFNTPSTFYAAFKKVTGMNPTEYQKKHFVK